MQIRFYKSDEMSADYPDEPAEVLLDLPGTVHLTYGTLVATQECRIPELGNGLYAAGQEIAEYDGFDQHWLLKGGTHWSDLVIWQLTSPDAT